MRWRSGCGSRRTPADARGAAGGTGVSEAHGEQDFECGQCDGVGFHNIDWVIAGGESGRNARPMKLEWVRVLRDECSAAGVPLFVKQLGGHPQKRDRFEDFPEDVRIREWPDV